MSKNIEKNKMYELEKMISSFFDAHSINIRVPVDIFSLATKLGFDVRGAILPDSVEGMIIVDEHKKRMKQFNGNKIIAYDMRGNLNSKKFVVAHELAHYIDEKSTCKGKNIVIAMRDHNIGYSDDEGEQEKDYMAAAILVPMKELIDFWKLFDSKREENRNKIYKIIANHFRVDIRVIERRVKEMEVLYGNT